MRDLRPPDPPAAPQLPGVNMLGSTPLSVPRDPLVSGKGGHKANFPAALHRHRFGRYSVRR
jgi:hypothetical protein